MPARLTGCVGDPDVVRGAALGPGAAADPERTGGFRDLLDLDGVDELLSRRGLRTPFLRMAKDGRRSSTRRSFTAPGGVGAEIGDQVRDDKVAALFARRRHRRPAGAAPHLAAR